MNVYAILYHNNTTIYSLLYLNTFIFLEHVTVDRMWRTWSMLGCKEIFQSRDSPLKSTQPKHSTVKLAVNSPHSYTQNSKSTHGCPTPTYKNYESFEKNLQIEETPPSHHTKQLSWDNGLLRKHPYFKFLLNIIKEIKYKCNDVIRIRDLKY